MLKLLPAKHQYAYCGPASLQMVLGYFHIAVSQRRLGKMARTSEVSGTSHAGMARVFRAYGFHVIMKHTTTTFDDLRFYVNRKKLPVIVNWYSTFNFPATGHYSVVIHVGRSTITLMDPEISRQRIMKLRDFNQLWFDFTGDLAFKKPPLKVDFRWMMVAEPKRSRNTK